MPPASNASSDALGSLGHPPLAGLAALPPGDVFASGIRAERDFLGPAGIRMAPTFAEHEIQRVRALIKRQLVANARAISPEAAADIEATSLERYHEVASRHDHHRLLSKTGRMLDAASVAEIRTMSFFRYVSEVFGEDWRLSDEEGVGHEQVCFRVVRPDEPDDVGSVHRDKWFWDHYHWQVPEGWGRAKAWVQVCGDPETSGLLLAPGSHVGPDDYEVGSRDGKVTFTPRGPMADIPLHRYMGAVGEPVLFNYWLLHVGSINRAAVSRVSFEITILFREGAAT